MLDIENKEIEFFGKITAASTHEMKNVLAIIKESSGLMADLMEMLRESAMLHREKFQNSLSVINRQIRRGSEISDNLNQFAHSTDTPVDQIDLLAATKYLTCLSQRFARLQNVDLKTDPSSDSVTVQTRPVRLLMTLFACIEWCLNTLSPGAEIQVSVRKTDNDAMLCVACKGDNVPRYTPPPQALSTDNHWLNLNQLAESLDGFIEPHSEAYGIRLGLPKTSA